MNHRDAEDTEEATKRMFLRSQHSKKTASTGNPKTVRVLCVSAVQMI